MCKQMISSQESDEEVAMILIEQQEVRNDDPRNWMDDMKKLLLGRRYPQGLDRTKRRQYRLQSIPYVIVDGILFRKDLNGALLRCIDIDQAERMIKELHDGSRWWSLLSKDKYNEDHEGWLLLAIHVFMIVISI